MMGCVLPHANPRDGGPGDVTLIDVRACNPGEILCGSACSAILTDPAHCGRCDRTCNFAHASANCVLAECVQGPCETGFADCNMRADDGCETPLNTSLNCGACGRACVDPTPDCNPTTGMCGSGCAAGQMRCGADCVDTANSATHCGGCNMPCVLPHTVARCSAGRCAVGPCENGFADCDGVASNGCETQLGTNANCAGCGMACGGATPNCVPMSRTCALVCPGGTTQCPGILGCIDPQSDSNHCGGCGRRCNPANAIGVCFLGECRVATCAPGFRDCDGNAANGCEVNVTSDGNNCGDCNRRCALAQASSMCRSGSCVITGCSAGYGDCDRLNFNGCESPLNTVARCGNCATTCMAANATPACIGGMCGYTGNCTMPFQNCDGVAANGCETNIQTSTMHCGGCGMPCSPAHVMSVNCVGGMCGYAGCSAGWADCDGIARNGCEVDVVTDPTHCGGCMTNCPGATNASPACVGSTCRITCNPGFANCDNNVANGCEVDTATSVNNCGRCGMVCPAPAHSSPTCIGARCGITCDSGWADCDGNMGNGCEADLSNANTCGRCNVRCSGNARCMGGSCTCSGMETVCGMMNVTCCTPMQTCSMGRCN